MKGKLLLLALCSTYFYTRAQVTPIQLGESRQLYSHELGEQRRLNIYLPDGYNMKDTTRYPVIYLLDGGLDEDFIHITGLVQFDSFEWIKRVPKSIVVGIVNIDRQRDFTYPSQVKKEVAAYPNTGHSDRFRLFLEKELQPFIEKSYHTAPLKTLIGESLGGLLAAEILLKTPYLFDNYVIVSPSIWWSDGSLLNVNPATVTKPVRAYIGVGKEGVTSGDHPHMMEVDANVLAEKLTKIPGGKVTVYFDYLPQESHATIGHPAVFNAFKLLFQPIGAPVR